MTKYRSRRSVGMAITYLIMHVLLAVWLVWMLSDPAGDKFQFWFSLVYLIFCISAICVCLWKLILEFSLPLLSKETEEEKERLEAWLKGEGYHRYAGSKLFSKGSIIIFELDGKKTPFNNSSNVMVHENYTFKDFDNMRVVERADGSFERIYEK